MSDSTWSVSRQAVWRTSPAAAPASRLSTSVMSTPSFTQNQTVEIRHRLRPKECSLPQVRKDEYWRLARPGRIPKACLFRGTFPSKCSYSRVISGRSSALSATYSWRFRGTTIRSSSRSSWKTLTATCWCSRPLNVQPMLNPLMTSSSR